MRERREIKDIFSELPKWVVLGFLPEVLIPQHSQPVPQGGLKKAA